LLRCFFNYIFINPISGSSFTVKDPKTLFKHIHRNNGNHPCLVHTYDYDNLKENKNGIMIFDRVFLDFDAKNEKSQKIKKDIWISQKHD